MQDLLRGKSFLINEFSRKLTDMKMLEPLNDLQSVSHMLQGVGFCLGSIYQDLAFHGIQVAGINFIGWFVTIELKSIFR